MAECIVGRIAMLKSLLVSNNRFNMTSGSLPIRHIIRDGWSNKVPVCTVPANRNQQ